MNWSREQDNHDSGNMDNVGRLIKLVGAREGVPDERFERSRERVRKHWEQVVAEQRARTSLFRPKTMAIAAGLLLIAGSSLVFWNRPADQQADYLASVERVLGGVQINGDTASKHGGIGVDTLINTGSGGRIALRMSSGHSLRIDSMSHVVIHSADHVSLEAGALYIDTAFALEGDPIVVSTPFGTAQDIGTQFQVRVAGPKLVVSVRQGLVEVLQPGHESLSVNKGHYVELHADSERVQRPLQADDPSWDWIETVTPEFEIEGATLEEYLRWYAQERGLDLVWAEGASRRNAGKIVLAGSITGTSLDEGLELVRLIAPFEYQLTAGHIRVSVQ